AGVRAGAAALRAAGDDAVFPPVGVRPRPAAPAAGPPGPLPHLRRHADEPGAAAGAAGAAPLRAGRRRGGGPRGGWRATADVPPRASLAVVAQQKTSPHSLTLGLWASILQTATNHNRTRFPSSLGVKSPFDDFPLEPPSAHEQKKRQLE